MAAGGFKNQFLSSVELKTLGFPEKFIYDYLNICQNFVILSTNFQAIKSGSQATTGAFAALTGWNQDKNFSGFTFDSSSGELTIPQTGEYILNAWACSDASTGIEIKAELYSGGAWADIPSAFDAGGQSAQINGIVFTGSVSQKIRIMVRDTGGAVNIASNRARLTITRKT